MKPIELDLVGYTDADWVSWWCCRGGLDISSTQRNWDRDFRKIKIVM